MPQECSRVCQGSEHQFSYILINKVDELINALRR